MIRIIVAVILIFVSVVLGVLWIWPKYQDSRSTLFQIAQVKAGIDAARDYTENLKEIFNQLAPYQDNLAKIDMALPSQPFFPPLFEYLSKIGSERGLIVSEVGSVKTGSLKGRPKVQEHSFSITVTGSYPSLKNFISVLEKSFRFINVSSISFSSGPQKGVFNFHLSLKVCSY